MKVTADNGDFLGILVNMALDQNTGATIYIPSLNKFLELSYLNDIVSLRTRTKLYFDDANCTGTAHLHPGEHENIFIHNHPEFLFVNQNTFYERVGDVSRTETNSWLGFYGTCTDTSTGYLMLAPIQVVPVDFTYPIGTPIGFE